VPDPSNTPIPSDREAVPSLREQQRPGPQPSLTTEEADRVERARNATERQKRGGEEDVRYQKRSVLVTLLAIAASVCVVLVSPGAASILLRKPAGAGLTIQKLETSLRSVKDMCAKQRLGITTRYAVFAAAMLLAVMGLSRFASAVERVAPHRLDFAVSMAIFFATTVVLGLFAVRMRWLLFRPMGRVEWMMNCMACGIGVAVSFGMNYRRYWR